MTDALLDLARRCGAATELDYYDTRPVLNLPPITRAEPPIGFLCRRPGWA